MSKKSTLSWLPSWKFVVALIILVVIVVGSILIPYLLKKKNTHDNLVTDITATPQKNINDDTDGDGLLDWEEKLWGLNPANPDTNGNGVSDKDEVDQYRHEKSVIDNRLNIELSLEDIKSLTKSDILTQQIYATLAATEQGGTVPDEAKAQISDVIALQIQQPLLEKNITEADIYQIDSNIETFGVYADNIGELMEQLPLTPSVLSAFITSLDKQEDMTPYQYVAQTYEKLFVESQKMDVPYGALDVHLNFVNTLGNLSQAFQILTKEDSDPVKTFQAFLQLESLLRAYDDAIQNITTYIERKADSYGIITQQEQNNVIQ